jgi:phosphoribosylformylglycinamidine (FGAM) synthase-like enzyme
MGSDSFCGSTNCQGLIDTRAIASGHDISDGGIVVALLEMAFAGNCGITVDLPSSKDQSSLNAHLSTLFAEELGLLLEVCVVYPILKRFENFCALVRSSDRP